VRLRRLRHRRQGRRRLRRRSAQFLCIPCPSSPICESAALRKAPGSLLRQPGPM
jgi:hypothetical protein